ncbi:MAG: hypothetical protein LBC07_04890, partial [Elusimicrobiota bacterium]|nr:hypothetical protein [Elusimicrobiota bacterium]
KNQFSQDLQKYKIRQQYNFGDYVKFYKPQTEFTTDFDNTVEVVGQVFCGYIVAQKENDLYVFDQHAAAERIRYEAYTKAIDSHTLKIQPLLIQENFETSASVCEILKENLEVLSDLGFSVSEFGDRTFKINAYPAILGAISIEPIIRKILDDIEQNKNIDIKQKREIIIMRSCRESIKAGDALPILEAKKLISDLFKCDNPFTCPHGRPTAWTISKNDLEKFFKRK